LEQEFIRNVCAGAPVRKIGCNGDDVSIAAIARRVGTQGRLLQKRHDPLVVIFDREGRSETSQELEQSLLNALADEGLTGTVIVGVPDRDIEVWMLADSEIFRASAAIAPEVEVAACEGQKAKAKIKHMLWGRGKRPYVETVDGPLWLKKARPSRIASQSPSFARLSAALDQLECWWLQQQPLI
jgi:hypothetical protein